MRQVWAILLGLVCFAGPVAAEVSFSSKSRASLFSSQTRVLDGRAAKQYAHSARLQPQREVEVETVPAYRGGYRGPFLAMARAAARRFAVPEDLFLRLVTAESNWNASALSHKGAIGLAQLMPGTARLLRVDPHDPEENLEGGARYLRRQYENFGTWRLALAAYNAGPEAVSRHGGVPPYAETQAYVRKILGK